MYTVMSPVMKNVFRSILMSTILLPAVVFLSGLIVVPAQPAWAVDVTVFDVVPGPDSSYPRELTNVNGTLFFSADPTADWITNLGLWKIESIEAGAVLIKGECNPYELTDVNGTLFFACTDRDSGLELWKSDGTPGGTVLVKDINPGMGPSSPIGLTNVDGTLYFTANPGEPYGRELWKSDGTPGGTVLVKDIVPGPESADYGTYPAYHNFVAVGDTLFFVVDDVVNEALGGELWKSDGTPAGTVMVKDINPGPEPSMRFSGVLITFAPVLNMINFDGTLFFQANDGTTGYELWKSDGTAEGTVMVKDTYPGANVPWSEPDDFVVVNGTLFFGAANTTSGRKLWKSDGTTEGTVVVKDVPAAWLTDIGGTLFFYADDSATGSELWASDGTDAGTALLKDINPGSAPSYPGKPVDVDGQAFFSANDGVAGDELWVSDGTTAGTTLLADISVGDAGSFPDELVNVDGTLFFIATNAAAGGEVMTLAPPAPGAVADSTSNFLYASTDLDPINTFTGELFSRKPRDLDLGGPMPLYFQRYYASYLRRSFILGDLGSNWRHNFDARLYWVGNTITYVTHDGRVTDFLQDLDTEEWNQLTNTDTPYQLYVELGEDVALYDPEDERVYTFDFTTSSVIIGRLVGIEDGHGNLHTVTYDLDTGHIETVSDGLGRTITFFYNDDAIPKISVVSDGTRSISFQYTDPIDTEYLTLATDGLIGVTEYTYEDTSTNADHALMTHMTRPRGNVPYLQTFFDTTNQFNSGKVATQTDADGNEFSFDYDGPETTLTDPFGNTRVHTHTSTGEFSNRQDQEGQSFAMGSDDKGRRNSLTDRLGDTTTLDYDEPSGNLASVTDADGATSGYDYTARPFRDFTLYDMTTVTHADGTTETFAYDDMGNATSHTDQIGNTSTATHNEYGQKLTVTNVAGGVSTHIYNDDATPAAATDPAGNTTTFGYDSLKRSNLITFADSTSQSFTYNDLDQFVTTTDENSNTTAMSYDANGNLTSVTDPDGHTTTFGYDGNDRQISRTGPLDNTARLTYHPLGKVETVTDANGSTRTFDYDVLGRHVATTDPSGQVWSQTYDDEGILASATDPLGNITSFVSDPLGRITDTTSPMGHVSRVTYDAMGRITATTDQLNKTITLSRDPRGLVSSATMPDGVTTASYARNELGQVTAITDPGDNEWLRSYDDQGRVVSSSDPLDNTTTTAYDNRNRPSQITYPGSLGTATIEYDSVGNPTRATYLDGTELNFSYDANNRLTEANGVALSYDANGRISDTNGIAVSRDPGGRITSVTLAPDKTVTYAYDANDRLTQVTDWTGGVTGFSYDAAGRLTAITRPNGVNMTNTWDADSRLTGIAEGDIAAIALTLDAKGQVTAADRDVPLSASAEALSTRTTAYDAAGQVSDLDYDGLGRLVDDDTRQYSWNLASRLTGYSDEGGEVTFGYDGLGRRLSRTSGGTIRGYIWNEALSLASVSIETLDGEDIRYYIHTPQGELLYSIDADTDARHFHHFDEMGNTVFLTNEAGAVTDSYAYTPYGIITDSTGTYDNAFTWQGQFSVMDEGNGLYYMRARYYDSNTARFISRDPIQSLNPKAINPYQYAIGNPLRFVDPSGEESDEMEDVTIPTPPKVQLDELNKEVADAEEAYERAKKRLAEERASFRAAKKQNLLGLSLYAHVGFELEDEYEDEDDDLDIDDRKDDRRRVRRRLEKARSKRDAFLLHISDRLWDARENFRKLLKAFSESPDAKGLQKIREARDELRKARKLFKASGQIESVVPELTPIVVLT